MVWLHSECTVGMFLRAVWLGCREASDGILVGSMQINKKGEKEWRRKRLEAEC